MAERRAARFAPDVEERLRRAGTVEDVLSHASQEISRASHQVGFAMIPATEATFEHLDFVPLDGRKVLVVLVSTGGHISHKVIEPTEPFGIVELQQAANFINSEFKGHSLSEVRQAVLDRLREEQTLLRRADVARAPAGQQQLRRARAAAVDLRPGHVAALRGHRRPRSGVDAGDDEVAGGDDRGEDRGWCS